MLAAERARVLLDRLAADGSVIAKEVAARTGRFRGQRAAGSARTGGGGGLCQRVYGGRAPRLAGAGRLRAGRQTVSPQSKQRVAAEAIKLIRPGSSIILDGGTIDPRARIGAARRAFRAQSSRTAPPSRRRSSNTREPRCSSSAASSSSTRPWRAGQPPSKPAQQIRADLFFLGVTGIHPDEGLTTGDPDEAAMKRTLAGRAAETYVLGSAEKIGAASPFHVIPFESASAVITDAVRTRESSEAGHNDRARERRTTARGCRRRRRSRSLRAPRCRRRQPRRQAHAMVRARCARPATSRGAPPPMAWSRTGRA